MVLTEVLTYIALALSVASIAITSVVLLRLYSYMKTLIDELGASVIMHKRYRRVKRYILVKFVCVDNDDYRLLANHIRDSVYTIIGPLLRHRCNIDIVSYKPGSKRAIVRVRGEAICVKYTLLALSIQHIGKERNRCIAIPIRTSGLISRLRRRYLRAS